MQIDGSRARQHMFDVFDAAKITGQQVRDLREKFATGNVFGSTWWLPDQKAGCFWGLFCHVVYGAQDINGVHAALYDKARQLVPDVSPWSLDPSTIQGFVLPMSMAINEAGDYVRSRELTDRHHIVIQWMNEYMDAHYWRHEGVLVNDFRTILSKNDIPASEIQEDIDYCMSQDDPEGYMHSLVGYRLNMRTDEIAAWFHLHNEALVRGE